jgi:hypothetical protein
LHSEAGTHSVDCFRETTILIDCIDQLGGSFVNGAFVPATWVAQIPTLKSSLSDFHNL